MLKINLASLIGYTGIIIILISAFSLGFQLTGKVIDSNSRVNITISSVVSINFTIDSIDFGGGSVNLGSANATVDTLGNVINGNWTSTTQGFVLENIGNSNLTLNLKSGKTSAEFLGGTTPAYQYNVTNYETGSCTQADVVLGTWKEVNTIGDGDLICNPFGFLESANSVYIDLRLVIPSDARIGASSDVFTATGTSI
ncbi:MAG: hypothetical protein WCX73_02335 [Candidatus Pacearchaeota archaeon]